MNKHFKSFYEPFQPDAKFMQSCLITFDANVLLHSYWYHKSAKEVFLKILQKTANQLWLTHQAALEYHRHFEQYRRFSRNLSTESKRLETVQSVRDSWKKQANHPFHDLPKAALVLSKSIKEISDLFGSDNNNRKQFEKESIEFSDSLRRLFSDKVGEPYKQEEIEPIKRLAEYRALLGCPPGLTDREKTANAIGDVLIWLQILKSAEVMFPQISRHSEVCPADPL